MVMKLGEVWDAKSLSKNNVVFRSAKERPFAERKATKEEPREKTYHNVDESLRDSKIPVTE